MVYRTSGIGTHILIIRELDFLERLRIKGHVARTKLYEIIVRTSESVESPYFRRIIFGRAVALARANGNHDLVELAENAGYCSG